MINVLITEAVTGGVLSKNLLLKILQTSQENNVESTWCVCRAVENCGKLFKKVENT